MAGGMFHQLDQTARNLLPFSVTILAMLVGMVPLPLPGYAMVTVPLMLMCLFYWVIHRPDLLRPLVVFMIGLLQDLIGGTPIGMTSMVLITAYWLLITQRRFFLGRSFVMLWIGFALVATGAAVVQWAVFALMTAKILDAGPVLVQAVLGVALFPLMAWLLQRLHRAYLS
ncbi:rod shape-determining protein MreD [Niveispirillum sp.]|uniref:rod shape-determining protein MreD n=1 Tax=Niveispirillum sp. TaxID=1917217 RepID=UPI001B786965|nr:rod shape-determining protein MreD [Niveispirillum sp.]MBP7336201.1 rod shape-determining protein MreD [Niveispirillum sp.]